MASVGTYLDIAYLQAVDDLVLCTSPTDETAAAVGQLASDCTVEHRVSDLCTFLFNHTDETAMCTVSTDRRNNIDR